MEIIISKDNEGVLRVNTLSEWSKAGQNFKDRTVHLRLDTDDQKQIEHVANFINSQIVLSGQPDIFIVNEPSLNRQGVDRYLENIRLSMQKEINKLLSLHGYNFYIGSHSNVLISSIEFNYQTAYKQNYLKLLQHHQLCPKTFFVNYDDDKSLNTIINQYNVVYLKTSFSSSSRCILKIPKHTSINTINTEMKNCPTKYYGYIIQPEVKILEEIRFLVVDGYVCLCFILEQQKFTNNNTKNNLNIGVWTFFDNLNNPPEGIRQQLERFISARRGKFPYVDVFEDIKKLCQRTFNLVNNHFRLKERFMRIDIFFTENGEYFINEIEPFASGRGQRCNSILTLCELHLKGAIQGTNKKYSISKLGELLNKTISEIISINNTSNIQDRFIQILNINLNDPKRLWNPNVKIINTQQIIKDLSGP
jgi:hypothetical protein